MKEHSLLSICSCLWQEELWGDADHEEAWYSQVGRSLCSIENATAWAHRAFTTVGLSSFPSILVMSHRCVPSLRLPLQTTYASRVTDGVRPRVLSKYERTGVDGAMD